MEKNNLKIGCTGDVMLGRLVNAYLDITSPEWVWGNLLPELHQTDFNLINLETALTVHTVEVPKQFHFKADPERISSLKAGRIDVVNLANNHVLDYGVEGLLETLQVLDRGKIAHVGAGRNLEEAQKPVILERKGLKIGIIGCTDNEPSWEASKKQPGIFYVDIAADNESFFKRLTEIRQQVDVLIVSIHWGPNMKTHPSAAFRQFAHRLIEAGVHLVHGHSAHIFQGIEAYKEGLILYDTGDFVDDYATDPFLRNDQSFFFVIECSKKGIEGFELIPTVINHFQVNKAEGTEAEEIFQRMRELSAEFSTVITAAPLKRP